MNIKTPDKNHIKLEIYWQFDLECKQQVMQFESIERKAEKIDCEKKMILLKIGNGMKVLPDLISLQWDGFSSFRLGSSSTDEVFFQKNSEV